MSVFSVCVRSGLRGSACSPCWLRTAPVICSSNTAYPGCVLCSRSYRYDAYMHTQTLSACTFYKTSKKSTLPNTFSDLSPSSALLCVCGCYPVVSGSSSDHPACGEYSEGHVAVLIPATRAGQGGRPKLHPWQPYIFAGP